MAVATPCWPAPVSAITRGLPILRVSRCWPRELLSLWAPVWSRSSRFSHTAAQLLRQPPGREQRGRAAGVVAPQRVQLGVEGGVGDGVLERLGELVEGGHQHLGDEPPAPGPEVPQRVGPVRDLRQPRLRPL